MSGFIEGGDRRQTTLFPDSLDDYISKDIHVFHPDEAAASQMLPDNALATTAFYRYKTSVLHQAGNAFVSTRT